MVANLARVVWEGTHQMRFEQRFQRVKGAHSVAIWRKSVLGKGSANVLRQVCTHPYGKTARRQCRGVTEKSQI